MHSNTDKQPSQGRKVFPMCAELNSHRLRTDKKNEHGEAYNLKQNSEYFQ